ncbi:MAG: hypothetical protein IKN47_02940 [Lachnospiraceae bacterium]|nr:hypothetical protein [Lachnospiraceae bacterium]
MTLLITIFAAVISTAIWYRGEQSREMKVGALCWMFWGAALMWMIDAIFEYAELGAEFFAPEPADMINDIFLGFSVIALALVIWLVILLVKDPKGVVKASLFQRK